MNIINNHQAEETRQIGGDRSQHIIWPMAHPMQSHIDAPELYSHSHLCRYYFCSREYDIQSGGELSFNSFMNGFPYRKWIRDNKLGHLRLDLTYRGGDAELVLFAEVSGRGSAISVTPLPKTEINTTIFVNIPTQKAETLMLSCQILARDNTVVADVNYSTSELPNSDVSVGIVVTTFNRPEDVEVAIKTLLDLKSYPIVAKIFIVNNGDPLEQLDIYVDTEIIPNRNLGGSGGFARGLYEIKKSNQFSHVMFMDDDAICHPISIYRSLQFLRYAQEPNAAVSGAMLYSEHATTQYELGAVRAPSGVVSINQNSDLRDFRRVIENSTYSSISITRWRIYSPCARWNIMHVLCAVTMLLFACRINLKFLPFQVLPLGNRHSSIR